MKLRTLAIAAVALVVSFGQSSAQWNGCGVGIGGAFLMGELSGGGPVGIGSQGEKAGLTINCDVKMNAFVAGIETNYDWYFGDVKTLGFQNELSVLGRLGVLTNNSNLLYAVAGWGRSNASFGSNDFKVDSWKIGFGDEFRIPNSPMYLDMRILYSRFDESDLGLPPAAKLDSLEGGVRLKFKFGPGMFGGKGTIFSSEEDPAPPAHSDPKLSAPAKKTQ